MLTVWRKNTWLRRLMWWVLLPIAAVYLWWQWMYPVVQFRYKLTVEVMTPDGIKSGSSVIEVRYSSGHPLPNPGRAYNDRVIAGEAVYVDLGRGKNLFVLLGTMEVGRGGLDRGDWGYRSTGASSGEYTEPTTGPHGVLHLPSRILQFRRTAGEEWRIKKRIAELKGQRPLLIDDFDLLPTIAAFGDLYEPESVRILQPDSLETTIGAGYKLDRVSLQMTDEPPSETITTVLPWLPRKRLPNGLMDWWINAPLIDRLGYASFKMPP